MIRRRGVPAGLCARAIILGAVVIYLAAPSTSCVGQPSPGASLPADEFRSLLAAAGVDDASFQLFDVWDGRLTAEQAAIVQRISHRLDEFDQGRFKSLAADIAAHTPESTSTHGLQEAPGALAFVIGDAISAEPAGSSADGPWLCRVELSPHGGAVDVVSTRVPRAWRDKEAHGFREPVMIRGVVLRSAGGGQMQAPLVAANYLQWRPQAGAPPSIAWLAQRGFDAASLDYVEQGRPFSKATDSREAHAFYSLLAILGGTEVAELTQQARSHVAQLAARWTADASTHVDPNERRLSAALAEKANSGLSPVWPMFRRPDEMMGEFVLLEGTARRAVRIVVDDQRAAAGLESYYELEMFTSDSDHLPLVVCAARLPKGFPTGDAIREPIRAAGVFFKRWAYSRRNDAQPQHARVPGRLAVPLIIAAEPVRLGAAPLKATARRQIGIGAVLAGALAAVWWAVARANRRDRLARSQRSRYDA